MEQHKGIEEETSQAIKIEIDLRSRDNSGDDVMYVVEGEKFTIPENYESGWAPLGDGYHFQSGITYSIEGEGYVKWLPNDARDVYNFYERYADGSFPESHFFRYSIEKFIGAQPTDGPKWGYEIDMKDVGNAEWDDATDTSPVDIGAVKKDGRWFFVRANNGERIDDPDYDDVAGPWINQTASDYDSFHFSNEPNVYNTGFFIFAKKEWGSGRGMIDRYGKVVFMPVYDTMPIPCKNKTFLACKDGQTGIINRRGEVLVPFGEYMSDVEEEKYSWSYRYSFKFTKVRQGEKYGAINDNGDVVIPIIYDHIMFPCMETGTLVGQIGSKSQILSIDGTELTPLIYDYCFVLGCGFFHIHNEGERYMADCHGNRLALEISFFVEKWHDVISVWHNEHVGVLTRDGRLVVPCVYEQITLLIPGNESLYIAVLDGMYGVIDLTNEVVVSFDYDNIEPMSRRNGLIAVLQNGKWREESLSHLRVK